MHNVTTNTAREAESDVSFSEESQSISLSTNLYPNYSIFEKTFAEGGPYPQEPQPQNIENHTLKLVPPGSNYSTAIINPIDLAQPTMFELGFVGRPSEESSNAEHWTADNQPLEILDLDPLSIEAWDMPAHQANQTYTGLLRFNVAGIAKSDEVEFKNFELYDGSKTGLTNDYYGAHTQPGGAYHLHYWRLGEEMDHSNKIIGYIYDNNNNAFPLMGLGTEIFSPILDSDNHLIGFESSEPLKKPTSGYEIRSDYVEARRGRNPQNGSIDMIPENAAGIFHVDYTYNGEQKSDYDQKDSYLLDAYNMGFVRIDGAVQKAYVQTEDYPYTVHTVYEPTFTTESVSEQPASETTPNPSESDITTEPISEQPASETTPNPSESDITTEPISEQPLTEAAPIQMAPRVFTLEAPSQFKKKLVDKITNFDPLTDIIEINIDSFGIDHSTTFAAGNNKRAVKKKLARQDFDFLYDQTKGGLYFNENGSDKGFGDGGFIAILKGAPDLSADNLKFI